MAQDKRAKWIKTTVTLYGKQAKLWYQTIDALWYSPGNNSWPLDVCFRDVKQFLGFEDPQNRVAKATTRTAPLSFFIYDLVLLWHAQCRHRTASKAANRLLEVFEKDLSLL